MNWVGVAILALMLASCATRQSGEEPKPAPAPLRRAAMAAPLPPPAFVIPVRSNVVYAAVTAYDAAGETSYSAEGTWTNWSNHPAWAVTWAWDAEAGATGYNFYWGSESRTYSHKADAGTNTVYQVVLAKPITNVTTFSHVSGLETAASVAGPWRASVNPLVVTNAVTNFFVRGIGATNLVNWSVTKL